MEKRHKYTTCDLYKTREETDIHFLLECNKLEEKRDMRIIRKFIRLGKEKAVGKMLFEIEEIEGVKKMIINLWRRRGILRKRLGK